MRERIMKLSDEAYVYASEKNSIHSPQLLRDYTEKLAELIVRECVELINAHAQNMEKYNFEDKAGTARSCAGIILEHFDMRGKK